jgi:hypothetical protein
METVETQATSIGDRRAFTGPGRQISYLATSALTPHPNNARKHSRTQIGAIAKSIEVFGFTAPSRNFRFGLERHSGPSSHGLPS